MKKLFLMLLAITVMSSCKTEDKVEEQIAKVEINFNIERFDQIFAQTNENNLQETKEKYPFMFAQKYPDSFWITRIHDTIQQELFKETSEAFPNLNDVQDDIHQLFQHIKFYYSDFDVPRVIATTSSVDYRNKVIVTDTIDLISLDTYLGKDHEFYEGIYDYLKVNFNKDQIVVDLAGAYAEKYIFQSSRKTLLDEMIYYGKELYFKDKMIPFKPDYEKIGYSPEQFQWAEDNEEPIWRYFIEKEVLFSTDSKLPGRFINPAPFSKFYLEEIDSESPGRIGRYIGWQIVRSYMENNDVAFQNMLTLEAEEIFNNSNFKPRK